MICAHSCGALSSLLSSFLLIQRPTHTAQDLTGMCMILNSYREGDIITLHACARDKAIGFVVIVIVVHARYRDLDVLASGQSCQDFENGEK